MLPITVAAFVAIGPLAAVAIPAFKTRMNTFSTSYDESISDVHVYVLHREMRHNGGLSSPIAMPMPMAHPHSPQPRTSLVQEADTRIVNTSSRSILSGTTLLNSKVDQLCSYRDAMDSSSSVLHGLAAMSAVKAAVHPLFASQCADELLSFQQTLGAYHSLFGELCADNLLPSLGGRLPDMESTLGNVALSVGNLMDDVDAIVANVPSIKAHIGPIVYGIKRALDDLASNIESEVGAGMLASLHLDLGSVQPKLNAVISAATRTACGCAVPALASLCH